MSVHVVLVLAPVLFLVGNSDLQSARDRQDRPALEKMIAGLQAKADKQPSDAQAHYQLALAESFAAEIAMEIRDKARSREMAEAGMRAAEKAVNLKGSSAEYHRMLGTLCGQMVSSNGMAGLRYAKCALNSVNKAIEMDPKSSDAYVSHGVGNYYLPPAFGGGIELAIKDFEKAIELNPKNADAQVWLGVSLRKANRPGDARKAFARALELNPNRVWAKQQLDKTPAQ